MHDTLPVLATRIAKVTVYGVSPPPLDTGLLYHGEPLYCHPTYDGVNLSLLIDERAGENLDPAAGQRPPAGPVTATVTLTYQGPYDQPSTVTWRPVTVLYRNERLSWSIRLSRDHAAAGIYVTQYSGNPLGPGDARFQYVVVEDPLLGVDEPYRLWRIENGDDTKITVRSYVSHTTAKARAPYDPKHGIIGPMGVVVDP